jgi:hypothetical protein
MLYTAQLLDRSNDANSLALDAPLQKEKRRPTKIDHFFKVIPTVYNHWKQQLTKAKSWLHYHSLQSNNQINHS